MVYFVQAGDCGRVKIGVTHGPIAARLRTLQTGCPEKLRVLCLISGGKDVERRLHRRFHAARADDGEWFDSTPELMAFIDGMLVTHAQHPAFPEKALASLDAEYVAAVAGFVIGTDVAELCIALSDGADRDECIEVITKIAWLRNLDDATVRRGAELAMNRVGAWEALERATEILDRLALDRTAAQVALEMDEIELPHHHLPDELREH